MARKLIHSVDFISAKGDKHSDRGSTMADKLFPGIKNPTGHLLDLLSHRQGK